MKNYTKIWQDKVDSEASAFTLTTLDKKLKTLELLSKEDLEKAIDNLVESFDVQIRAKYEIAFEDDNGPLLLEALECSKCDIEEALKNAVSRKAKNPLETLHVLFENSQANWGARVKWEEATRAADTAELEWEEALALVEWYLWKERFLPRLETACEHLKSAAKLASAWGVASAENSAIALIEELIKKEKTQKSSDER